MIDYDSSAYFSKSVVSVRENPRFYSKSFLDFGLVANLGNGGFCNQIIQVVHAHSISEILNVDFSIGKYSKFKNKEYNDIFSYINLNKKANSNELCNFFLQRGWGLIDGKAASRAHRVLQIMGIKINKKDYMKRFSDNFKKIIFQDWILDNQAQFVKKNKINYSSTLGVHIRTNDYDPNRGKFFRDSDLDKCTSAIKKIIDEKKLDSIFISGCSKTNKYDCYTNLTSNVVDFFKKTSIQVFFDEKSSYLRDSPEWIRDLLIISNCAASAGHKDSTFSFVPSFLGDCDFIPVQ